MLVAELKITISYNTASNVSVKLNHILKIIVHGRFTHRSSYAKQVYLNFQQNCKQILLNNS